MQVKSAQEQQHRAICSKILSWKIHYRPIVKEDEVPVKVKKHMCDFSPKEGWAPLSDEEEYTAGYEGTTTRRYRKRGQKSGKGKTTQTRENRYQNTKREKTTGQSGDIGKGRTPTTVSRAMEEKGRAGGNGDLRMNRR